VLPVLVGALCAHRSVVLRAPTGAGKTTRVPPAVLGAVGAGLVVMLEPRRVAARAAARWMASELGEQVGQRVGYQIRLDRRASAATRILVITEGVLVRMLQDDPFLTGVAAIIFDEFHERSLSADLALAMARKVQREVRDDLKLLVMSATLDPAPIAAWLGDAAVVESEGRRYPVEVRYARPGPARPLEAEVRDAVVDVLDSTAGDVLVFLPGVADIRRCGEALDVERRLGAVTVLPLHGGLDGAAQDAALRGGPQRRVVLATNVAETSVTVEGVRTVIDSGLVKSLRHDPATGLDHLGLRQVSLASAEQRAGRAGREAPGLCVRLWTEHRHRTLEPRELPEVHRVDLTGAVLELLAWGEADPMAFPWFEAPEPSAVERAMTLLRQLGATDGRGLTPQGRRLAALPVHPRLGRMLQVGHALGHTRAVGRAAALLSDRDPFASGGAPSSEAECDILGSVNALGAAGGGLDGDGAIAFLTATAGQLERLVVAHSPPAPSPALPRAEVLSRALLAAWPDRVVLRREPGGRRGVMVGGRGVELAHASHVRTAELFVAVDLDDRKGHPSGEALVRRATAIDASWLDPANLDEAVELVWDADRDRVTALRRRRYLDLVLATQQAPIPDAAEAAALLRARAAADLTRALGLDADAVQFLRNRLAFLARHMPELGLTAWTDEAVTALLPTLCHGLRSFEELRRLPLADHLRSAMPWPHQQALERHAPTHLTVPTGSAIRLTWPPAGPPILAVKIQELFGLAETPTVADARVPVLLHLLAPNRRPQQITQDLAGFWTRTWPEVRKELRQRYPRHAWPEDPLRARPEKK